MRTLEALGRLCRAEDYFAFLGVSFDPDVLEAHRALILRRWAQEVAQIDGRRPLPCEAERLDLYAAALRRVHALFARSAAERPFRVIAGGLARACGGARG